MRKILALFVAFMFIAGLSYAAVENIKVSGGLKFSAYTEALGMGGGETLQLNHSFAGTAAIPGSSAVTVEPKDRDSFLLMQAWIQFDADLTENVEATVRLLSERDWGDTDLNGGSDVDVEQAYVTLKQMIYEPLTLIVGRQPLKYGMGFLIADPDTKRLAEGSISAVEESMRTSFDAIRAILDYSPWTIDLVYAKVQQDYIDDPGDTINIDSDQDLWGINVRHDWEYALVEMYMFQKRNNALTEGVHLDKNEVTAAGVRGMMHLNQHLSLFGEAAYEFGEMDLTLNNNLMVAYPASAMSDVVARPSDGNTINNLHGDSMDVRAWAGYAGMEYRFMNDYDAKMHFVYEFCSGDDENSETTYEGWDPFYTDFAGGEIMGLILANTNAQYMAIDGEMKPREDITLWGKYAYAMLAEKLNHSIVYAVPVRNNYWQAYRVDDSERSLGQELDLGIKYDYTEDVQIGATGAWYFPGDYFGDANDAIAWQLKSSLKVTF